MSHMLRINRCFWQLWINVEMKDWMMDPPIPKTTIQKSHVLDVLCCNHKWVSDYNVFPMWQLVFTVPICQAFERERHILQEVCYSAEMRFFFPHWDSPPTEIITIFLGHWCILFFVALHRKGRDFSWKGSRVETWVQGSLWHSFILLALLGMMNPAMADTVETYGIPDSLC